MTTTTEMTPAQVDTRLAQIYTAQAQAEQERMIALRTIDRIDEAQGTHAADYSWNSPAERDKAENAALAARIRLNDLATLAAPLEERYAEERWTRYYLVTNGNGHVHSSQSCSTCFPTTQYAWLTEQSGMTAEALVDLAGEAACTVCFPWAPVDVLQRKSALEAPERKAAREERERKAAERKAATLTVTVWHQVWKRDPEAGLVYSDVVREVTYKTVRAASNDLGALVREHHGAYAMTNGFETPTTAEHREENIKSLSEALEARDVDVETLIARNIKRAEKER